MAQPEPSRVTQLRAWMQTSCMSGSDGRSSEGVEEAEIGVEEAGGVLQLGVVADVLVQNGHCRPLDLAPAGWGKQSTAHGSHSETRSMQCSDAEQMSSRTSRGETKMNTNKAIELKVMKLQQ